MSKVELIIMLLDDGKLPMLEKSRELTVQEYMKLKHTSLKTLAENKK